MTRIQTPAECSSDATHNRSCQEPLDNPARAVLQGQLRIFPFMIAASQTSRLGHPGQQL